MSHFEQSPNPEDLSARARRGDLSRSEQRELDRAMDASATVRVAHLVGCDLDRSTAVRAGDEDLILRAADAALARVAAPPSPSVRNLTSPRSRGRRYFAAALLAAAMISASGIAAAVWVGGPKVTWLRLTVIRALPDAVLAPRPPAKPRPVAGVLPKDEIGAHDAPANAPEVPVVVPVPPAADEAPAVTGVSATPLTPAPKSTRATAETTAAELFRHANASRRGGDFARARRLYSELIAKYPSSEEARLAQVSLGKLLLAEGENSKAEREFGRYLSGGEGQLAEEALVSQAQSLERLKRTTDERQIWLRLLSEHPKSVYAAQAKARLQALNHVGASPGP